MLWQKFSIVSYSSTPKKILNNISIIVNFQIQEIRNNPVGYVFSEGFLLSTFSLVLLILLSSRVLAIIPPQTFANSPAFHKPQNTSMSQHRLLHKLCVSSNQESKSPNIIVSNQS